MPETAPQAGFFSRCCVFSWAALLWDVTRLDHPQAQEMMNPKGEDDSVIG